MLDERDIVDGSTLQATFKGLERCLRNVKNDNLKAGLA